jgi:hypothetical protein
MPGVGACSGCAVRVVPAAPQWVVVKKSPSATHIRNTPYDLHSLTSFFLFHSLTHPPTHSHSPTHPLTHSLTHSPPPLTHSFTHSPTHYHIELCSHQYCTQSLTHSPTHLHHSLTHPLTLFSISIFATIA